MAAGHDALISAPTAVEKVTAPDWRLTATQEHRAGFTVGRTKFIATTSGWPTSTSADLMAQHAARSIAALHARAPEKFDVELARFNAGVPARSRHTRTTSLCESRHSADLLREVKM